MVRHAPRCRVRLIVGFRGRDVKSYRSIRAVLLAGMMLVGCNSLAADDQGYSVLPRTNGGEKWRIGYYEGGGYDAYYDRLVATVEGLMELGWLESQKLPIFEERDGRELWAWLASNANSKYIEFVRHGFVSASWDDELRLRLAKNLVSRLREDDEVDLMLAMGTRAGQDLANNSHSVPTVVITSTDPVKSGIVQSVEDSGRDHVHARVDPFRNERQVSMFHDIVGFSRLGIAFENSLEGRNYAAIEEVKALGKMRGFEVVACYTLSDIPDAVAAGDSVKRCFNELVRKSDAIYVTMQGGVNRETIPDLVAIANRHRVPTLSQMGESGVRSGFLMSVSIPFESKKSGRYYASVVAKIFNGAKPRSIAQISEESPNIALNLKTAEIVGLYLQADILAAADTVFSTIEIPE